MGWVEYSCMEGFHYCSAQIEHHCVHLMMASLKLLVYVIDASNTREERK